MRIATAVGDDNMERVHCGTAATFGCTEPFCYWMVQGLDEAKDGLIQEVMAYACSDEGEPHYDALEALADRISYWTETAFERVADRGWWVLSNA